MQRTNGTRSTAGDHSSTATSLHNHHSAHSSRFTAAGSRQETKAALAPRAPSPQSRTVDQLPNSIQSASRTNDVSSQVNSSPQLASPPHEGRNLNHSGDHQFRSNQNGLSPTTSHSNATADIPSGLTFQSLTTPVQSAKSCRQSKSGKPQLRNDYIHLKASCRHFATRIIWWVTSAVQASIPVRTPDRPDRVVDYHPSFIITEHVPSGTSAILRMRRYWLYRNARAPRSACQSMKTLICRFGNWDGNCESTFRCDYLLHADQTCFDKQTESCGSSGLEQLATKRKACTVALKG